MKISIDGPSGVGKSTLGNLLAQELGYAFLSTGRLYRAVAYILLKRCVDINCCDDVVVEIETINIFVKRFEHGFRIFAGTEDLTDLLDSADIGVATSTISAYPQVRDKLGLIQQNAGNMDNIVMEGRDIGSVIMPDADIKFYLTASTAERGQRRFRQFVADGESITLEATVESIKVRDKQDMERAVAPLVKPVGAVEINSTGLTVNEALSLMRLAVKNHLDGLVQGGE